MLHIFPYITILCCLIDTEIIRPSSNSFVDITQETDDDPQIGATNSEAEGIAIDVNKNDAHLNTKESSSEESEKENILVPVRCAISTKGHIPGRYYISYAHGLYSFTLNFLA